MQNNELLTALNNSSNEIIKQIPELTYIGDVLLRTKTNNVTLEDGLKVGHRLIEILKKYRALTGLGVGLAAPQIGSPANVFVTYKDEIAKIFINPQIIDSSAEKNVYKENCLSSSHVWCDVSRSKSITITYMNEQGG